MLVLCIVICVFYFFEDLENLEFNIGVGRVVFERRWVSRNLLRVVEF